MKENIIKFKLSKEYTKYSPEINFEYSAYIDDINSKITWINKGKEQYSKFSAEEIEDNFKNGKWVRA